MPGTANSPRHVAHGDRSSSVGENVPLVTCPTCSPANRIGYPSRGTRLPASSKPARRTVAAIAGRLGQCVASRERAVFEVHREFEPGLKRIEVLVQFMAV